MEMELGCIVLAWVIGGIAGCEGVFAGKVCAYTEIDEGMRLCRFVTLP